MTKSATTPQFSVGAQIAFRLSEVLALCFRHEYVGSEHLLLAIFAEQNGPAAKVLRARGITYENLENGVLSIAQPGPEYCEMPNGLFLNIRYKLVTERAKQLAVKNGGMGTGQLLLSIIQDEESTASQILWNILQSDPVTLRGDIIHAINEEP